MANAKPGGKSGQIVKLLKNSIMEQTTIHVGGQCPADALNISEMVALKVAFGTIANAAKNKKKIFIADDSHMATALKVAPFAAEYRNGKAQRGIIIPVGIPGEGYGRMAKEAGAFDSQLDGGELAEGLKLADMEFGYFGELRDSLTTHVGELWGVPVERYRAPGDLQDFADADAASADIVKCGGTPIILATNLEMGYVVNRVNAVKRYGLDFIRVVILKDRESCTTPDDFNGSMILTSGVPRRKQVQKKKKMRADIGRLGVLFKEDFATEGSNFEPIAL